MLNFFNKYPYSDMHEMNLDWLIAKMKELNIAFDEFKVVNNITFSGAWDITKQYPAWTIVSDNNIGYVSIQPVPAGVPLTNDAYWVEVIDYTAQIAGLETRVINLENITDILQKQNEYVTPEQYGAAGDGITDDTQAFTDAIATGKPVFAFNSYHLTSTVELLGDKSLFIYGDISYTGSGAAFDINGQFNTLYVKRITGNNSNNGIRLYQTNSLGNRITAHNNVTAVNIEQCVNALVLETSDNNGIQYNNIKFELIRDCITGIELSLDVGWINSNYFNGGRIGPCTNGIHADVTTGEIDGNSFNNIGIEVITGRGIELKNATSNSFTNIRFAEDFTGDYMFYLVDSSMNKFEGDMNIACSQVYDEVTNISTVLPRLAYNYFKAKLITNVPTGTWLDTEMYSFNNTFMMLNYYNTIFRGDTGDQDLTASGTIYAKNFRLLLGNAHAVKLPYLLDICEFNTVIITTSYTITKYDNSAFTLDLQTGGGNKIVSKHGNEFQAVTVSASAQ